MEHPTFSCIVRAFADQTDGKQEGILLWG